jgi:hypothetical protein
MALVTPPRNDKKRVKVYELRNNDWFDRGTGFCMGQVIEVREDISSHQLHVTLDSVWSCLRMTS